MRLWLLSTLSAQEQVKIAASFQETQPIATSNLQAANSISEKQVVQQLQQQLTQYKNNLLLRCQLLRLWDQPAWLP